MRDIRAHKQQKRRILIEGRHALPKEDKLHMDASIQKQLQRLQQYRRAQTVLLYVSTAIEVDTHAIIHDAFTQGKRVALPRCVEGTRLMSFFYIRAWDDLEVGSFGLLEPRLCCEPLQDYANSICLVPALSYDRSGYRLGYGGGYYDRFLCKYPGPKIGIIYAQNISYVLTHGRFDRPVDIIVCERGFFYTHHSTRPANR